MSEPKLSLILPIFEVEDFIQECVASIKAQTMTDFEVICVNDATLDNSIPILKCAIGDDPRFKIIHNKMNRGLGGARNAGLDVVRGEYVQFVDSDDSLRPNMCQKLVSLADMNQAGWAICSSLTVTDGNYTFLPPYHSKTARQSAQSGIIDLGSDRSILFDIWPSMWLGVRRRSLIGDLRFDENVYYEDHRFHFEFGQKAGSLVATEEPLYLYRSHADQITKDNSPRCFDIFDVLESVKGIVANDPKLQTGKIEYARYLTRVLLERFCTLDLESDLARSFVQKSQHLVDEIWRATGKSSKKPTETVDNLRPDWADIKYARRLLLAAPVRKTSVQGLTMNRLGGISSAIRKNKDRRRRRLIAEVSHEIKAKLPYWGTTTPSDEVPETSRHNGSHFQHMVLINWFLSQGAGGPPGYLANLRRGIDQLKGEKSYPIYIQRLTKSMANYEPRYSLEDLTKLVDWFGNTDNLCLPDLAQRKIANLSPKSIHAHICTDMVALYNHFDRIGQPRPLTIFSSHAPESWGKEVADIWRSKGHNGKRIEQLERVARLIEAKAFREADVWVFPSAEAMEPYYSTVPRFKEWAVKKDIRFVRTGSPEKICDITKELAKHEFGLSGQRVISFVGRHIEAKGYDLMKEVGVQLLDEFEDLTILIAGKQEGLPELDHPRWKELGWYNQPELVIRASDVFVLPNKNTYFDLVMLEAMSLSAAVVASATGGNKTIANDTGGAVDLAEASGTALTSKIRDLLINDERRTELGQRARRAYEMQYTETTFAQNYVQLVSEIQDDYGVRAPENL
ncbi:glycosyltransferase [uncultured Tateyamaria sp.]|uniref:glycosyltransferase n=1 Tax=uncultured Tateyamaria sp. TaxID=455651 RepID=UPI00262C35ED|nr:glycosyltransferase [uncultured Tateyamaria sp.]